MSAETKEPSNAEILVALQGMWRQEGDLMKGIETRLGAKLDTIEERLAARMVQEIQDRPVVVSIDMSRVGELERRVDALTSRLADIQRELEAHRAPQK